MYEANTFMPVLHSVFSRKKSTSIMEKQYSSSWWVRLSSREKIQGARKAGHMPCVLVQVSCKHSSGRTGEVLKLLTDVRTEDQKYFCTGALIWVVTSCCIPMSWSILCGGRGENTQVTPTTHHTLLTQKAIRRAPTFHVDFRPSQSPWTCMVIPRLCLVLVIPPVLIWLWPEDCLMCLMLLLLHCHICLITWALGSTPMPVCLAPWLGVVGQALTSKALPQYSS